MKLRNNQDRAYIMAKQSIQMGMRRPVVAAVTAFGKTVLAAKMLKNCEEKGKIGWFLCDRKQLIEQSIDKFTQMGINFGVKQAQHELTNPNAPIQIVSIQTLAALINTHKRALPDFDFAIVDECHTQYEIIDTILEQYDNIPVIGLTATPYSKGLGLRYNNLIVPSTPREMLEEGYWCPVKLYVGEHVDLSKIRSNDPNTYSAQDLERETEADSDRLAGGIIKNWLALGEDSQTIAFSPSQNFSKGLVEQFRGSGLTAEHIDCYTEPEERRELFEAHDAGEFKILSCSRLLNVGYDSPSTRCIIDCYPTKSVTTYVQRDGRIRRIFPGKEYAIYLDHAGNFDRFGYAEDIVPTHLDDGTKTHNESELTSSEGKEIKTQDCPQCYQAMVMPKCHSCGYQVPVQEHLEDDGTMLVEAGEPTGKVANKTDSRDIKEQFYSELIFYGKTKGYKKGWSSNQYREKYGVWPNKMNPHTTQTISDKTKGWLRHQQIKYANRKSA